MDEFEMISHGDRVLVAISCSASSLSLLHALRQFSRARNIIIELGACSIGAPGIDPRALMLYLRDLGIRYHYEEQRSKFISCVEDCFELRAIENFYFNLQTALSFSNHSHRELKRQIGLDSTKVQIQCTCPGQYTRQIGQWFHYVADDQRTIACHSRSLSKVCGLWLIILSNSL